MHTLCTALALLLTLSGFSNPFVVEFETQEELSSHDWQALQQKLRAINVALILDPLYPGTHTKEKSWFKKPEIKEYQDFYGRVSRGVRQTLINEERAAFPRKELIKINKGGTGCLVSLASYDGIYTKHLKNHVESVKKTGWNGYFLVYYGGYPHPTGIELRYAGVPYAFKVFALLEANKLGFEQALWLDAALEPLKTPQPIFDELKKTGSFFQLRRNASRYLLPSTRKILLEKTGVDMNKADSLRARIIGFDFSKQVTFDLIKDYYELVELETPFISCFPEEYVLGALVEKYSSHFKAAKINTLIKNERKLHGKTADWARKKGYHFLLKDH